MRALKFIFVGLGLFSMSWAWAADNSLAEKEPPKASDKKVMGWTPTAKVSLNGAVSDSSGVVGQPDGTSQTYGVNMLGNFNFASEHSEWQNGLSYIGATSHTPTISTFIKSNDELKFNSLYLHDLPALPEIGPYAKFTASAPVFNGEDVRETVQALKVMSAIDSARTRKCSAWCMPI